mgnify:CR=1 FL=1
MREIRETSAYAAWFAALRDRTAKARSDIRIRRLSLGNAGDISSVGEGYQSCASITVLAIGSISKSMVKP